MTRRPFWQGLWRRLGYIPLDKTQSQLGAVRRAVNILKGGKNLVVFPEGDAAGSGALAAFSKGAAVIARLADVPIVPVATVRLRAVAPHKAGALKLRPLRVRFGEPIPSEQRAAMSSEAVTAEVRHRIEKLLGA
jgi:1-acyl-sn-glycerol-3-phosphate acyltransferase